MTTDKIFFFTLLMFLLQRHVRLLDSVPCAFNTMCLCWIDNAADLNNRMDISCLGVAFARFPDVAVSYVAQLDIVNSGMQVLEDDALVSSSGVEALGLMSNRLATIGDKSLIGVSNSLRSLDLSYNSLEEVPFKALQGLRKLNWLNMHRNHLTSLDCDWGHVAETLTNGFFGENSITRIPPVLATFERLVWLNIDDNNIEQVPADNLAPGLRTLSLNGNLLTEFPRAIGKLGALYLRGNFIRRLELPVLNAGTSQSLELIDVSDNLIESIGFSTSSNASYNIKDLNISSNKLARIPPGAFEFLGIRRLHLSSNNMSYIDDAAFRGLENILEHLNLDNNHLHTVPRGLAKLKKLTSLYLANNNIYNISSNAFESFAKNLRALSLATNNLASVPVTALSLCQKLLHLNLGYNKITHVLPGSSFQWAENLEILVLRNNLLVKLVSGTFLGAGKLKELSLSFNQLVELDDGAFAGIEQSLEILELSFAFANSGGGGGDGGDALPIKNALASLTNLRWLVLDNNNLHTIDADALVTFTKLRYVNLESNRITHLPRGIVRGEIHRELADIMLGYNYFENIPNATFVNLSELKLLDLAGNRIQYLAARVIENCPKLVTISLAYNRIFSIDRATWRNLPNLRFLHLEFNALTSLDLNVIAAIDSPEFSLNVSFNSISVIKTTNLTTNLTSLDLGCNNLTKLASDAFAAMPNLRSLNLGGNFLTILHPGTFALHNLETLNLRDNRLENLRKQVFHGSTLLQQLDLSGNLLSQLSAEQFRNLWNLRVVNLARNRIRSISRDVFEGTRIESLNLSANKISNVPSSAFVEIGFTLRDLNLADNLLEHLDAFSISHLTTLCLASNRLTTFDDNPTPFASLTKLVSLDLSHNIGLHQVNFTRHQHQLLPSSLHRLYLANCSLRDVPAAISLMTNLKILDLSFNHIETLMGGHQSATAAAGSLKVLKLINNLLSSVPDVRLPLLRHLDLSGNPIQRLEKNSFSGVPRLEKLILRKLQHIEHVDSDCLRVSLPYLKHVIIQTWTDLRELLHGLPLQTVEIEFTNEYRTLNRQIHHAFTRRLRELIITGAELQVIAPEAFSTIESSELILRIQSTSVQRFQSDIFLPLARKMSQLTLDLRNNHINEFSPSVIYGNLSWETVGTNLVAGGLQVSGNALECDCEIAWLSLWLRRWLREAHHIHARPAPWTMAEHAICTETPACQASALTNSNNGGGASALPLLTVGVASAAILVAIMTRKVCD